MSWPHDVLSRFRGLERAPWRAGTWKALCPAHVDRSASLSLWTGRDGRLMVGCWARCDKKAVLACAGLKMSDLFPPHPDGPYGERNGNVQRAERRGRVVARYEYHDEGGELLYRVCRTDPKGFFQQRPNGEGGWLPGLGDVRRVLYRLPEVLTARCVLVVEGEKDVHAAEALGLTATCNPGGCGMGWLESYSLALRGKRVAVLPDGDEAGLKHARCVVGSLVMAGVECVRCVRPPANDLADWLAALPAELNARAELIRLVKASPEWRCG